jgi:hypothetical protein
MNILDTFNLSRASKLKRMRTHRHSIEIVVDKFIQFDNSSSN